MNFLAHAYLSFQQPHILVGNLVSDFVKGRAQFTYPANIQTGFQLHRAIDAFTDAHPATKEAVLFFKPHYRLYAGAIVDILYDHFLATDQTIFPGNSLLPFTQRVYETVEAEALHLPPTFARVFVYMRTENWLWGYRTPAGIQQSLRGLARRATYMGEADTAFALFETHYEALKKLYDLFIKDVKTFSKTELHRLTAQNNAL